MPVGADHRAYDAARKARDPEYRAKRVAPRARTNESRERERERHAERMVNDPGYREQVRAKKRRYHARHVERVNARRLERQRENREQTRERVQRGNARRKARKLGAFVEDVQPFVVLELHDGVCGVCGSDVDPSDFHVDHVIPLARGGEHSYANVQPAHPVCNYRKGVS